MEIKTHATEVWRLSIVKSLQTPDAPFSHIMFFLLIPNKNIENLWKPPTDKIQIEHLLVKKSVNCTKGDVIPNKKGICVANFTVKGWTTQELS